MSEWERKEWRWAVPQGWIVPTGWRGVLVALKHAIKRRPADKVVVSLWVKADPGVEVNADIRLVQMETGQPL